MDEQHFETRKEYTRDWTRFPGGLRIRVEHQAGVTLVQLHEINQDRDGFGGRITLTDQDLRMIIEAVNNDNFTT